MLALLDAARRPRNQQLPSRFALSLLTPAEVGKRLGMSRLRCSAGLSSPARVRAVQQRVDASYGRGVRGLKAELSVNESPLLFLEANVLASPV